MTPRNCILITLGISVFCIVGDYFLKRASTLPHPFSRFEFAVGTAIFAATSVGWVLVLPHMKLGIIGTVYGVSTVLFMALLGYVSFGESLYWFECVGILLGVASIILLARLA